MSYATLSTYNDSPSRTKPPLPDFVRKIDTTCPYCGGKESWSLANDGD
jgi:hypothetical protein